MINEKKMRKKMRYPGEDKEDKCRKWRVVACIHRERSKVLIIRSQKIRNRVDTQCCGEVAGYFRIENPMNKDSDTRAAVIENRQFEKDSKKRSKKKREKNFSRCNPFPSVDDRGSKENNKTRKNRCPDFKNRI